jgi:hypothetical protein
VARVIDLSVLVCTANRPTWLEALLRSLAEDPTRPGDLLVCVVDNSPEGSAAPVLAKTWPFTLVHSHLGIPNIADARNEVLRLARSPLVLMLDDDQLVAPGFFLALERAWRARPAWSHGLRLGVVPRPEPGADPRFFAAPTTRLTAPHPVTRREFATNGLLLQRDALVGLGAAPFDSHFSLTGGEDTELFVRLAQRGTLIAWAPSVTVLERVPSHRATLSHMLKTGFRTGMTDAMIALRTEGRTRLGYGGEALKQLVAGSVMALAVPLTGTRPGPHELVQATRFFGKLFALAGGRWEPYRTRHTGPAAKHGGPS